MNDDGIKQLEDLFALGDSDVNIEDIYSEDVGSASFEEKKNEIKELLEESKEENEHVKTTSTKEAIISLFSESQSIENKEVINKKEIDKNKENIKEKEDKKSNLFLDEDIDFDTEDSFTMEEEKPVLNVKKEEFIVEENSSTVTRNKEEKEQIIENLSENKIDPEPKKEKIEIQEKHKPNKSGHYWQLTYSDAKFKHFYQIKKERLEKFLVDGEVPYASWKEELIKARVDLSSLVFDLDHLSRQMQAVQQYQYRVGEIRMRVNAQYNWCKRSLEFLRGKLAQIAYEKPIEKFNGVVYDHLSDVEDYLQQLEILKDNSEIVTKNLDKAAEVISRRVTVVMLEVKTDNKGNRYIARDNDSTDNLDPENLDPMNPVNFNSNEVLAVDEDAELLKEFDSFEIKSVKSEEKPKKSKWWSSIPKEE